LLLPHSNNESGSLAKNVCCDNPHRMSGQQRKLSMVDGQKTAIVTGASQGIGAGLVKAFLDRGYNVVANSRNITKSGAFDASDKLALVDGSTL
jgi:3-oxoacyl-ACP reductase-like protein